MKTVIVGANHAGIAAANTLLEHYPGQRVVMIDQNSNISYLGCGTALWVGRQIESYKDLFYTKKEDFENKGAAVHMETMVKKIDFEKRIVFCEVMDGTTFEESYDKLILATGSLPIEPDLPGQNLEHISFLKLFQDGQNVDHLIGRMDVKQVAVIGAGYIGIEIAEAAIRRGKRGKLFDVADTSLAGYYDEWFTKDIDHLLEEKGIETHFRERVLAFFRTTAVERIVTDHGEYKTDLVVSAIGFRPNTVLGMEHLKLFKNGAYCVDCHQQTSDPDVYAVGDCAAIYSNALKKKTYIALATNAVRSGIVAGHNIGGTALEETGVQGSNGISVFGHNMVSTGLSVKAAQKKWVRCKIY